MAVKTERLILHTTPEFKNFLAQEARREGVSVSELVRARCRQEAGAGERELVALLPQLRRSLTAARASLRSGVEEASATVDALRKARGIAAS